MKIKYSTFDLKDWTVVCLMDGARGYDDKLIREIIKEMFYDKRPMILDMAYYLFDEESAKFVYITDGCKPKACYYNSKGPKK